LARNKQTCTYIQPTNNPAKHVQPTKPTTQPTNQTDRPEARDRGHSAKRKETRLSEQSEGLITKEEGVEGVGANRGPIRANQGPTRATEERRPKRSAEAQSPRYTPQDGWQKYGKSVRRVPEDDGHLRQEGGTARGWVEEAVKKTSPES